MIMSKEVKKEVEQFKKKLKSPFQQETEVPERIPKDFKWQDYLGKCLKKVNPNDPESSSHIELLKEKGMNPNEQMRACGVEWKKDRLLEDPLNDKGGFVDRFHTAIEQKEQRQKEIE